MKTDERPELAFRRKRRLSPIRRFVDSSFRASAAARSRDLPFF